MSFHALLTPVVANAFDQLRISVALLIRDDWWYPIHAVGTNVMSTEYEQGVAPRRFAYNHRCFAEVHRTRRIVVGEHAGFFDLFVPVLDAGTVRGVLVAGPLARTRPTSAAVLERWYALTGLHGRLGDPAFADYLATTLLTLTLEGKHFGELERLMSCFAALVAGQAAPEALAAEADSLLSSLREARASDFMWEAARRMVDERNDRYWAAAPQAGALASLGLERVPEHAVVGLLPGRNDERDPIDDVLQRDALQRACVALARKAGSVVCGQVGDYGIVFLCDYRGSAGRVRSRLVDLAERAAAIAKRFGFRLHAGVSRVEGSAPLAARYRAALGAAEKALARNLMVVHGEPRPERSAENLRELRARLGTSTGDRAGLLVPRFDRYIEAVLVHCGYRLESTRAHLDAGLERIAEPLLARGSLDKKGYQELLTSMDRTFEDARTVADLVGAYRHCVADLERIVKGPTVARQDRGTRRAAHFVREHIGEPLGLTQVARVAGYAPGYFSKLFKRDEGIPFEHYVRNLRLGRAKQMLTETNLSVEQVQELCGFTTRTYFHRVFKKAMGVTPAAFRTLEK